MISISCPAWFDTAPCRGKDKIFFSSKPSMRKKALDICNSECSNSDECLDFAVSQNITIGVWGGKTGPELRRMVED